MPRAPTVRERFVPACACFPPRPVEIEAPFVRGGLRGLGDAADPAAFYVTRTIETTPPACGECRAEWKRTDVAIPVPDFGS